MRYIHKWHTPVVLRVFASSEPEFVYYAPCYDPTKLPALVTDNLYWRMPSYPTNELIAQWYLTGPGQEKLS